MAGSRAIKEARAWCDEQGLKKGRKPSNQKLVTRFPVLRTATDSELQYIYQRETPHDCSIEIIHGRTPHVARATVIRYLLPMRRQEPSAK
jgi:hypothetical protein